MRYQHYLPMLVASSRVVEGMQKVGFSQYVTRIEELTEAHWEKHFEDESILAHSISGEEFHAEQALNDGLYSAMVEYLFWKERLPTIYVSDRNLVEMVMKARYDIDLESLYLPRTHKVVCFSFPSGLVVDGVKITPILAARFDTEELWGKIAPEETGIDVISPSMIWGGVRRHQFGHYCFRLRTTPQLQSFLKNTDEWNSRTYNMTPTEHEQEVVFGRLVFGLLTFMAAFPDALKVGYPLDMKEREIRINHKHTIKPSTLLLPENLKTHQTGRHVNAVPHWRRGHFRSLRDERYKRDDAGRIRVVWVRDALVDSRKTTPYHINKEEVA